jgi:hypothetical protein
MREIRGRRSQLATLILAAAGCGLFPRALAAQADCFPATDSHEAKALALISLPVVFSRVEAPAVASNGLRFGLEAARLPRVSDRLATPTVCRPGKGPENVNILPGLLRPRITLPIGHGLEVEGSWIPPVRVNQVKANLFGLALSASAALGSGGPAVGLRAHATFGVIHAPITCDDAALRDPTSECFGGTRSDDEFHPATLGAEAAIGWPLLGGRLRPYGGVGYSRLRPRFRVNFTNSSGDTDRTRVEVNLDRTALFGGASWLVRSHVELTGEVYGALADGVIARVAIRARA